MVPGVCWDAINVNSINKYQWHIDHHIQPVGLPTTVLPSLNPHPYSENHYFDSHTWNTVSQRPLETEK